MFCFAFVAAVLTGPCVRCAAVSCPAIPGWTAVPNSDTVTSDASCVAKSHYQDIDGAWQQSQCHVMCKVGYTGQQKNDENYQCTAGGSWSGSLSCPAVSCPANSWWSQSGSGSWVPGLPGHWDSPSDFPAAAGPSSVPIDCSSTPHKTLDATCAVTCNAGYNANGNTDTYMCVANGREQTGVWQGTADLVCAPVSCDQVSDPAGGTVTVELQDGSPGAKSSPYFSGVADPSTSNGGTTATYTCNDGFVLNPVGGALTGNNPTDTPVDQRVLYCNTDGKWADNRGILLREPPTCFDMCNATWTPCVHDGDGRHNNGGECTRVSRKEDSHKYTCTCGPGWQLQKSRPSQDLWVDQGQMCEAQKCTDYPIDHSTTDASGSSTCSGQTTDTCHVTCAAGYTKHQPDKTISCQTTGRFESVSCDGESLRSAFPVPYRCFSWMHLVFVLSKADVRCLRMGSRAVQYIQHAKAQEHRGQCGPEQSRRQM
jgi:hypothetical protein